MSNVTLHIETGDHPDDCAVVALSEFLTDNCEDVDTCEAVRALNVGDRVTFGGGAAPVVTVERVS
jgi:hypothetical protein